MQLVLNANLHHRLFEYPQMDFEMAIWEMTSLMVAPKKVFKSIYYHVSHTVCYRRCWLGTNFGTMVNRNVSFHHAGSQLSYRLSNVSEEA